MSLPALLFFFRIVLLIEVSLRFHITFSMCLSISAKTVGTSVDIALTL